MKFKSIDFLNRFRRHFSRNVASDRSPFGRQFSDGSSSKCNASEFKVSLSNIKFGEEKKLAPTRLPPTQDLQIRILAEHCDAVGFRPKINVHDKPVISAQNLFPLFISCITFFSFKMRFMTHTLANVKLTLTLVKQLDEFRNRVFSFVKFR